MQVTIFGGGGGGLSAPMFRNFIIFLNNFLVNLD